MRGARWTILRLLFPASRRRLLFLVNCRTKLQTECPLKPELKRGIRLAIRQRHLPFSNAMRRATDTRLRRAFHRKIRRGELQQVPVTATAAKMRLGFRSIRGGRFGCFWQSPRFLSWRASLWL